MPRPRGREALKARALSPANKAASPAPPKKPPVPRGPNAKRREATRIKLLEATIDCLYRYGYFGTSTVLVTEVAGVSRGSLLHQFPTKVDLMISTAEYIALKRGEAHRRELEPYTDPRERFRHLPWVTWKELSGPSGVARLELMLAARSDPEFAERMTPLNDRLEQLSKDAVWNLVSQLGVKDRESVDAMVRLYIAAVRGLAIDGLYESAQAELPRSVALLQQYQEWLIDHLLEKASKA